MLRLYRRHLAAILNYIETKVKTSFTGFPSDTWSIGVVAFVLLTGLSPFLGTYNPKYK